MLTLRVVIPGRPSTAHRPRFSGMSRRGRPIMRTASEMRAWKERVRAAARGVVPDGWPMHATGPRGGKLPLMYGVSVLGYYVRHGYDADNLRGALDALEGVLWPNDRRCKPVLYDTARGPVEEVVLDVVAWDPRRALVTGRLDYREETG